MTNKPAKIQARSRLKFIRLEERSGVPNQTSIFHDIRCAAERIDSDHRDIRAILPLRAPQYSQCEKPPIILLRLDAPRYVLKNRCFMKCHQRMQKLFSEPSL
jgi:hypothetical protein